jgi:hypothetical protein
LFGTFGEVTFLGGTTATVNYDEENGVIFLNNFMSDEPPGAIGDYNDNGVVDAADYPAWRKFNGTSMTLPNDQSPGSVLPVDYDVWVQNFGESGGGSSAAVPELSSLTLAALLITCCLTRRPCPVPRK